ncbi:MAG: hypothetical protein WC322_05665 [Candidatus Paceibacterota bacterium]|jgi:hypothetical protein
MIARNERCKEYVPDGGRCVTFHQCYRRAVRDGYCKQHHPEAVAERARKSDELYRKKWENDPISRLIRAKKEIERLRALIPPSVLAEYDSKSSEAE